VDNLVHYNWHWRWHWGGGEIGNNGPHAFDLARWGLGVELPVRISCNGGRYHFQDDQETPDTSLATLDFGTKTLIWDGSSCHPRRNENLPFVAWYGDGGTLANYGNGYKIFDAKGKQTGEGRHRRREGAHREFPPGHSWGGEAELGDCGGQTSTLLCHLSNIAYRTGTRFTSIRRPEDY
jgi:predicted dehydrogenase